MSSPCHWCILRTAGPSTLRLVRTLTDAGIAAWSPMEKIERRYGVSRKRRVVPSPLLPTFVFAEFNALPYLCSAAQRPTSQHPTFTVFRHGDGFPRVPDAALDGLRQHEEAARIRALKKAPKKRYFAGQTIRAPGTAFEGLDGKVVETSKGSGNLVLIDFPGFSIPVKIAPWLLQESQLNDEKSERDTAPREAKGKQCGAG